MKKCLILLLVLFICLSSTGQNKPTKYKDKGIDLYNDNHFKKALTYFEKAIRMLERKNTYDSTTVFYAGLAALKDSNFNKAILYFDKSRKSNYKITKCIMCISDAYRGKNDLANAEKTLKEGIKFIPKENNDLILRLSNLYIAKEQLDTALVYLAIAIKNDTNSAILYFSIGAINQGLGNVELTIQAYKHALQIDPTYYDANYNLSTLYYNHAADLHDEQQKIPISEDKKYEDMKLEINAQFLKALPYLENCYRIRQDDAYVISSLKIVYERLQIKEKGVALYNNALLELLGKDIVNPE